MSMYIRTRLLQHSQPGIDLHSLGFGSHSPGSDRPAIRSDQSPRSNGGL